MCKLATKQFLLLRKLAISGLRTRTGFTFFPVATQIEIKGEVDSNSVVFLHFFNGGVTFCHEQDMFLVLSAIFSNERHPICYQFVSFWLINIVPLQKMRQKSNKIQKNCLNPNSKLPL